jgi:hypothetical protein
VQRKKGRMQINIESIKTRKEGERESQATSEKSSSNVRARLGQQVCIGL